MKLRLGHINVNGQQKGVDSLIILDLVELSRNKAISDAVVLSGDEDVRAGISVAQSLGVRVHLLGVASTDGSQARDLIEEADTLQVWAKEDIASILSVSKDVDTTGQQGDNMAHGDTEPAEFQTLMQRSVDRVIDELPEASLNHLLYKFQDNGAYTVPKAAHAPALKELSGQLGRDLSSEETSRFNYFIMEVFRNLNTRRLE